MRQLNLTRDEAEFLVDVLERDGTPLALMLADELRQLFGMSPRKEKRDDQDR